MENNEKFGLPPGGWNGPEIIEGFGYSTAPYAVSAAVATPVPLFINGTNTGAPWLQNLSFQALSANRRYRILGLKAETPIGFTPGTGATVGTNQMYFAANSNFTWQIESKENTVYRVLDLAPFENYVFGITQAVREKQTDYVGLYNPIDLPSQGLISCIFNPAPSLPVTSATASIDVPGMGYTNNVGHYVRLVIWYLVARPTL